MRAIVTAAALIPLALVGSTAFEDGPPPAHTGGFGEPTCAACHFDGPVDDGEGDLSISGLPEEYEPGTSYRLRVVLSRAAMAKGGFELAARTACDGAQAGDLEPADRRTALTPAGGIAYLHQTGAGTSLTGPDSIAWTFDWTAPASGAPVVFSVAANAADGDASQLGDHIYTHSRSIGPR